MKVSRPLAGLVQPRSTKPKREARSVCDRCGKETWRDESVFPVPDQTPCTSCSMGWMIRKTPRAGKGGKK